MADDKPNREPATQLTRWSLVARASHDDSAVRVHALNELLAVYCPVLCAYLVSSLGFTRHRAEDMVQRFVADKVLQRGLLRQADPAKGRFRSFLLRAFSNYAISELRKERARRRGPSDSQMVHLDETPDAVACAHAAEQAFDVAWARQTLAEALQRLRAECERKGRADLWGIFECRILEPTLNGTEPPPYEQLVERFGMVSPSQASNLLITAKRMFTRVLAEVVRDTVSEEAEVQAEIRDLARILAGSGG